MAEFAVGQLFSDLSKFLEARRYCTENEYADVLREHQTLISSRRVHALRKVQADQLPGLSKICRRGIFAACGCLSPASNFKFKTFHNRLQKNGPSVNYSVLALENESVAKISIREPDLNAYIHLSSWTTA